MVTHLHSIHCGNENHCGNKNHCGKDLYRRTARQSADNCDNQDRAKEGDYQRGQIDPAQRIGYVEQGAGQEATNNRPNDPEDDITQDTITAAFHHQAG
jgi:hypothetical protein